jgi:2-polyprenyl-6-methoxyphenol hydroxylase-like FAD-dependent oxidoreductase
LSMMAAMQAFKWGFGTTDTTMTMLRNMGLNSVNALPRVKKWFIRQAVGG